MHLVLTCETCGDCFQTIRDAAAHEDKPGSECSSPNSEGYHIELTGD